MPKEYSRIERIADLLQRELAKLIQQEVRDPRLSLISITAVDVSKDLAHAKIFFTQLKENADQTQTAKLLNKAANHLRYHLAQTIDLRIVPKLRFIYDTSISQSAHLSALIDSVTRSDPKKTEEE